MLEEDSLNYTFLVFNQMEEKTIFSSSKVFSQDPQHSSHGEIILF